MKIHFSRSLSALLVVGLGGTACGNTATLMRNNGPDYEAAIDRSDAQVLYVRAANGQVYKVPRREVYSIDHPGNITMNVGLCLLGFGAILFASSFADSSTSDAVGLRIGGLMYAAPGLGLALLGGLPYYNSKAAAHAFESAAVPPVWAPDTSSTWSPSGAAAPSPWGPSAPPAPQKPPAPVPAAAPTPPPAEAPAPAPPAPVPPQP